MDYSQKIAERLWNLPDKGELESHREETFIAGWGKITCLPMANFNLSFR